MNILHYIAGPVLGAIIGYITNYIAIRMLFQPYEAKYILGHKVPFTPGIIPRRKDAFAEALGQAVFEKFFNWDDLEEVFLSDTFCDRVCSQIIESLKSKDSSDAKKMMDEMPEEVRNRITDEICDYTHHSLIRAGYGGLARQVPPMLKDMINQKKFDLSRFTPEHIMDVLYAGDETQLKAMLKDVYMKFMREHVRPIVESVDIVTQITSKMKMMTSQEVESLALAFCARELKMVIWFGAFLGAVIGVINIFI
ncbi:MAG: DUF445 family protein [Firmicutes bacterium]|nr:DUF445 family protein [Bacillota bacterium]